MTSSILRLCFGLAGALLLAPKLSAHPFGGGDQVCNTVTVARQPTNWNGSITFPQFDHTLGHLDSIEFTINGHMEGSVGVENLDAVPATSSSLFSSVITITLPDSSVVTSMLPVSNFIDALAPFDGTVDFRGASGVTHAGIVVNSSDVGDAPDGVLSNFIGTGNITLPISALGTELVIGGNFATHFTQNVGASIDVCYGFSANMPPMFDGPCGQTLMLSVGVPYSFLMCGLDVCPKDDIPTLSSSPLPSGSTFTPPLPASGSPICCQFDWTPTSADVGPHVIDFTVSDLYGASETCSVTLVVAECYHLLGRGAGNTSIVVGGHLFTSNLGSIRSVFPVTLTSHPALRVPILTSGQINFSLETVMFNPIVFPAHPDQWSERLSVTILPHGEVVGRRFGTTNGIHQSLSTFHNAAGHLFMTFPFSIDGM